MADVYLPQSSKLFSNKVYTAILPNLPDISGGTIANIYLRKWDANFRADELTRLFEQPLYMRSEQQILWL
jgi:hypothetical protein